MRSSTPRRVLATLLVLSLMGAVTGGTTLSALASDTDNAGNTFAAGSVNIADNDGGGSSPLYNLTGKEPGQGAQRCIKVTYGGTLNGEVRLYTDSALGALGPYTDITITPGTQSGSPAFASCAGFTPDPGGNLFSGTLSGFRTAHSDWATGLADAGPGNATSWTPGDSVVYRYRVTVADDDAAVNKTTGTHRFVWEGQNK